MTLNTVLVSIITMLLGVVLGHTLATYREKRSYLQKEQADIIRGIEELIELAVLYHTSDERNKTHEVRIKIIIDLLDIRMANIRQAHTVSLSQVRMAITLKNFETTRFIAKSYDDPIILKIKESAQAVIQCLKK